MKNSGSFLKNPGSNVRKLKDGADKLGLKDSPKSAQKTLKMTANFFLLQLQPNRNIGQVELEDGEYPVSTVALYHVNQGHGQLHNCANGGCNLNFKLEWNRESVSQ